MFAGSSSQLINLLLCFPLTKSKGKNWRGLPQHIPLRRTTVILKELREVGRLR